MPILDAIFPILLISLLGYLLAKFKVVSQAGQRDLSTLTFTILIPALLFLGISKADLSNAFYGKFLAAYFIPVFIIFIGSMIVGSFIFRLKEPTQTVFSMSSVYSNATVIGLPMSIYVLGEKALVPLSIIVTFHNFFLFSLATLSAERHGLSFKRFWPELIKIFIGFIKNPITMSLLLGIAVNLSGIQLPSVLKDTIGFVSSAAVPIAFIVLGASLNAYGIRGHLVPALYIIGCKMILLPLFVWYTMFHVIEADLLWAKTAVLIAAAPVGIATHVFAQRYNTGEGLVPSAIVISTVLSVIGFSFWINFV